MTDRRPYPEFDRAPRHPAPKPSALALVIIAIIIGWPTFIAAAFGLVSPITAAVVWAVLTAGLVGFALVAK